jgi:radical SAM enzyme (TIGR01210 family)
MSTTSMANASSGHGLSDAAILAARPPRNAVSAWAPYHFLVEDERTAAGTIEPVATLFLTNRECLFRCLMCDLWKNTLTKRVPLGAIPAQIDFALARLPPARHIKLYNSGNFFDAQAIPPEDHAAIAARLAGMRTVIVENHPRLCGPVCGEFARRLEGELEVALGLETIHPEVLPRLNKRMTVADFDRASADLAGEGIAVRAFILLRPPFLDEEEGVEWCLRSVEHAFDAGARVCSVIPTRGGNGIMEQLAAEGQYAPPRLRSLELVLETALAWNRGRVFVDLWDAERFATCPSCAAARVARLHEMNFQQRSLPRVDCASCGGRE